MSQAQNLHDEAMLLANEADDARLAGDDARSRKLSELAFEKEKAAAFLLLHKTEAEPTRSILFRSAAQLALDIGAFKEAEKLATAALFGAPPFEIAQELRDITRQTNSWFELMAEVENPAISHDYMKILRGKALHFSLRPKQPIHAAAIYLEEVIDALSKIRSSFASFLEVNFQKRFAELLAQNPRLFAGLKAEARLLLADLRFESFSASVSSDAVVMARQPYSDEVSEWRGQVFEAFKNEVFFQDYESLEDVRQLAVEYSDEERQRIFKPVLDLFKDSNACQFSVTTERFSMVKKRFRPVSKPVRDILLPQKPVSEMPPSLELQQVFAMSEPEKAGSISKTQVIARQMMTTAAFDHVLEEIAAEKKSLVLREPLEIPIRYEKPIFSIDFAPLSIHVHAYEYHLAVKEFQKAAVELFEELKKAPTDDSDEQQAKARTFFEGHVFSTTL